jgi:dihydroxyacetone kinase-like predicted kinase
MTEAGQLVAYNVIDIKKAIRSSNTPFVVVAPNTENDVLALSQILRNIFAHLDSVSVYSKKP